MYGSLCAIYKDAEYSPRLLKVKNERRRSPTWLKLALSWSSMALSIPSGTFFLFSACRIPKPILMKAASAEYGAQKKKITIR
jgi:hypothetical protein